MLATLNQSASDLGILIRQQTLVKERLMNSFGCAETAV